MSRKKSAVAEAEGGDVTGDDVIQTTPPKVLKSLMKKARDAKKEMQGLSGDLGQAIGNAVENDHLHRKAFGHIRQMDQMTDEKLAEYFAHRDYYEDVTGLRERANKVIRMDFGADKGEVEQAAE